MLKKKKKKKKGGGGQHLKKTSEQHRVLSTSTYVCVVLDRNTVIFQKE